MASTPTASGLARSTTSAAPRGSSFEREVFAGGLASGLAAAHLHEHDGEHALFSQESDDDAADGEGSEGNEEATGSEAEPREGAAGVLSSPAGGSGPSGVANPTGIAALDEPLLDPAPSEVPLGQCRPLLDELGVRYRPGRHARGIEDPIVLAPEVNGVKLYFRHFDSRPAPILMDCRLALALYEMTRQLRDVWAIESLVHHGVYNYRCIVNSDPCRLSQHAMGLAIDLGALRDRGGREYSVTRDFVASGRPTCPGRASDGPDQLLKDFACWLRDSRTFSVVLTPNYNQQHRNHYHVDLTGLGDDDGDGVSGQRLQRAEVDPVWFPGLRQRRGYYARGSVEDAVPVRSNDEVLGVAPLEAAPLAGQVCAPQCSHGRGCGLAGGGDPTRGATEPSVCAPQRRVDTPEHASARAALRP